MTVPEWSAMTVPEWSAMTVSEVSAMTVSEVSAMTVSEVSAMTVSEDASCAWAVRMSRVPMAMRGLPLPKQSPLAVDTPTRRPVYEPGPLLTHTASQSAMVRPFSSSISWMKTAVRDACALGAELSRYAVITPSSARAAEQRAVDVSMRINLSIIS